MMETCTFMEAEQSKYVTYRNRNGGGLLLAAYKLALETATSPSQIYFYASFRLVAKYQSIVKVEGIQRTHINKAHMVLL